MTDLNGVRAKLALARANAEQLKALLPSITNAARGAIFRDQNSTANEALFRIRDVPWIDPCLSALFGQGITSIRSAWDHLAWQLVLLDGGQPNRHTQFPLHDSEFSESGARRSLRIEPSIRRDDINAAVEAIQPFRAGPLWSHQGQMGVVNELARIDKHRLLVAVATMLDLGAVWWGAAEDNPVRGHWFPVGQPLKDGDIVARFMFDTAAPGDWWRPNLDPIVALDEGPLGNVYRNQSLDSLLNGLASIAAYEIDRCFISLFQDEPDVWIEPGDLREWQLRHQSPQRSPEHPERQ